MNYTPSSHSNIAPNPPKHGSFAGSHHQGQTGTIIIVPRNNCEFAFFLVVFFLIRQADWSQRPVLKSNLQTPTWLLLISHELFITAITSPRFLSSSSTAAGHPFSLFLHLADLTSFPPSPTPSFDLRPSIQPFSSHHSPSSRSLFFTSPYFFRLHI